MTWDPVHDSRAAFLACLRAQCSPGVPAGPMPAPSVSPDSDLDAAAGVLLALLDDGCVLAVDGPETAVHVAAAVCRTTGARLGAVQEADVVLVTGDAALAIGSAPRGSSRTPETGATIVATGSPSGTDVRISGPGVPGERRVRLPATPAALAAFTAAAADYPCGVDLLLVQDAHVVALPRSSSVVASAGVA
jgi:alpha-D-ribose 1-methylphosphonate 5-triphosphate synthase subunit PhnH